jgi:hypothetical protein
VTKGAANQEQEAKQAVKHDKTTLFGTIIQPPLYICSPVK